MRSWPSTLVGWKMNFTGFLPVSTMDVAAFGLEPRLAPCSARCRRCHARLPFRQPLTYYCILYNSGGRSVVRVATQVQFNSSPSNANDWCGGHCLRGYSQTSHNPYPLFERYFHDLKWMCPRYFGKYILRLMATEGVVQILGSS